MMLLFFQLEFQEAIFIKCVAIYETYHGGKVKAILGRRKNSGSAWETQWHKLWSTTQIQDIKEARIFSPSLNVRRSMCSQLGGYLVQVQEKFFP